MRITIRHIPATVFTRKADFTYWRICSIRQFVKPTPYYTTYVKRTKRVLLRTDVRLWSDIVQQWKPQWGYGWCHINQTMALSSPMKMFYNWRIFDFLTDKRNNAESLNAFISKSRFRAKSNIRQFGMSATIFVISKLLAIFASLTLARIWVCALIRIVAWQCVLFSDMQSVFGHAEFTNSSRNADCQFAHCHVMFTPYLRIVHAVNPYYFTPLSWLPVALA